MPTDNKLISKARNTALTELVHRYHGMYVVLYQLEKGTKIGKKVRIDAQYKAKSDLAKIYPVVYREIYLKIKDELERGLR